MDQITRRNEYIRVATNVPSLVYKRSVTVTQNYQIVELKECIMHLQECQNQLAELRRAIIFLKNLQEGKEGGPYGF